MDISHRFGKFVGGVMFRAARVHRMSDRTPSSVSLRNMQIGPNIHVETYVPNVTDEICGEHAWTASGRMIKAKSLNTFAISWLLNVLQAHSSISRRVNSKLTYRALFGLWVGTNGDGRTLLPRPRVVKVGDLSEYLICQENRKTSDGASISNGELYENQIRRGGPFRRR